MEFLRLSTHNGRTKILIMKAKELQDRIKQVIVALVNSLKPINKSSSGRIIYNQVIRSSMSVGSNYRAACRARSDKEFYAKLCICVEECDETVYWLDLLMSLYPSIEMGLPRINQEFEELLKILSKSRSTIKSRMSNT